MGDDDGDVKFGGGTLGGGGECEMDDEEIEEVSRVFACDVSLADSDGVSVGLDGMTGGLMLGADEGSFIVHFIVPVDEACVGDAGDGDVLVLDGVGDGEVVGAMMGTGDTSVWFLLGGNAGELNLPTIDEPARPGGGKLISARH